MPLTITIPGAVSTTTGSTAPAVLTVGVGAPGQGVPAGGTAGQVLTKVDSTDYNTVFATPSADFITAVTAPLSVTSGNLSVNLSTYLTTADAASTYYLQTNPAGYQTAGDLSAALSAYLLSSTAASTYYPLVGNPSGFLTSAPVTSVAGMTGAVVLANTDISGLGTMSTATAADYSTTVVADGLYYPLSGNPSAFLTDAPSDGSTYGRNNGAWAVAGGGGFITSVTAPLSVTSNDLSVDLSAYVPLNGAGGTPTSITLTNATGTASSLTSGLVTTNANLTGVVTSVGNATAIADGALSIGKTSGLQTALDAKLALAGGTMTGKLFLPASTASNASLYIYPGDDPTTTNTGDIWVDSSGVMRYRLSGTSEFIAYRSWVSTGFATKASPTLTGTPLSTTAAVDTNTTQIATTAFVVGQAGSATPLVNGVAAVGTSLRYARADHVHGTDTTRAALASPTFTGTPLSTTAAVDTNTTQIATTAYVIGNGYLKSATASSTYAPLASPALTGVPTAPTAAVATNTTQIATTAFVLANAGAGAVTSVAGRTGAIVLAVADVSGAAPLASPTFTGTVTIPVGASISGFATTASLASYALIASPALTGVPTAPTALSADSSTTIATTAFVKAQGYITSAPVTSVAGRTGAITLANTDISGLGTMATATATDYSTTTVANGLYYPLAGNPSGFLTSAPVTSVAGRTGAITLANTDISGLGTMAVETATNYLTTATAASTYFTIANAANKADLASPTFTGTPTLPTGTIATTQTAGNSTTAVATTAFVTTADNLKANLASPSLTGTPLSTTAAALTNTTQIATTAFVRADNNVKAWVNFQGTGTVAIRGSFNVSSITDNGTGDYTVNFATALADANYAVSGAVGESTNTNDLVYALKLRSPSTAQIAGSVRIGTNYALQSPVTVISSDFSHIGVMIIR